MAIESGKLLVKKKCFIDFLSLSKYLENTHLK